MKRYPRVESVRPLPRKQLLVGFEGGAERVYDCTPLLDRPDFARLREEPFFRLVQRDPGGHGVSWNDDVDLAEAELWEHGQTVSPTEQTT